MKRGKLPFYVHFAHGHWRMYRRFDGYTKEVAAYETQKEAWAEARRRNGEWLKEKK